MDLLDILVFLVNLKQNKKWNTNKSNWIKNRKNFFTTILASYLELIVVQMEQVLCCSLCYFTMHTLKIKKKKIPGWGWGGGGATTGGTPAVGFWLRPGLGLAAPVPMFVF